MNDKDREFTLNVLLCVGIIIIVVTTVMHSSKASAISCQQFKTLIIKPALNIMGKPYDSPKDEKLLLITAANESHIGRWLKQGYQHVNDMRGHAVGVYMMEPGTYKYLTRRTTIVKKGEFKRMIYDLRYATVVAIERYMLIKKPIPSGTWELSFYYAKYWYRGRHQANRAIKAYNDYERLCA